MEGSLLAWILGSKDDMRKNIIAIFGIVVVVLLNTLAFAEKHSEQQSTFNVTNANQSFQELHSQLKTHHDYKSIVFYVEKIQDYKLMLKNALQRQSRI